MDFPSHFDRSASFALSRKRSPLPSSFRTWHVVLCFVAASFLLSMVLWKAFQIHDLAVALQRERMGQVAIQTIREPIARLLQQIETVGGHARTLAATYKRLSEKENDGVHAVGNDIAIRRGVCDAPPRNQCFPPLEKFLGTVGPYPQALYFIRYAYVSSGSPVAWYNRNSVNNSNNISTPTTTTATTTSTSPTTAASPSSPSSSSSLSSLSSQLHCSNQSLLFASEPVTVKSTSYTIPVSTNNSADSSSDAGNYFWHECGCDLVDGCYFVDDSQRRQVFNARSGKLLHDYDAKNLSGSDYIMWIKNLSKSANSRGEWNDPTEFQDVYSSSSTELLLQFSVPMTFDNQTGQCTAAASIDISSEFIASVLAVEEAANATLFIVDRRGPTLLGQSSSISSNRVVRRKFNPLLPTLPSYASPSVHKMMPLFRNWIGGSESSNLPQNETQTVIGDLSLAISPVGDHWVLLQAIGASDVSLADEYQFMKHGRLYLGVVVGAALMLALLLIEFVHGTFPSADWKFDDEDEDKRRGIVEAQRKQGLGRRSVGGAAHKSFDGFAKSGK